MASVGLLGVTMMTQKDYFIHPHNFVAGDKDTLSDLVTQAPNISVAKTPAIEIEASASRVKMQQTLFEHSKKYHIRHAEFKITEKYLSVLTEKQRQQLISVAGDVVP